MTSRDFCYWLQGYFEIEWAGLGERCDERLTGTSLSAAQTTTIQKHLAMVFKHEIDPSYGDKKVQSALDAIHQGQVAASDIIARC